MRIGFVLQERHGSPSGLDSYTWNLWEALRAFDDENEYVPVTLPARFARRAYLRLLWEQLYLPFWARRTGIDLLHVPAGSAPVARGVPCVMTLHDLGDAAAPGYRTPLGPRLYFGRAVPWSARFATALLADSAATKRDAVERLGIPEERITVVPLAPAACYRKLPQRAIEEVRRKYGLSGPYFLQVGAVIPRKNLGGALGDFAQLLARHSVLNVQFAVAGGRAFGEPRLPPETKRHVADGRVRFLGHVPQEDLVALYNGALAVVLPSFYEGFGLPLVEGFACGTPAIASAVASLPEVGGDAALYVDPHDPRSIAGAMERYVTSPGLRSEMASRASERSRSFSWRRTAEGTLAVYRRVSTESRARPTARRALLPREAAPRVLFVRLDSLGDVVLTTPCFEAVKRRYPAATVDVVVQPANAPLLEGDPRVDRVFTLAPPWRGRSGLGGLRDAWRITRRLRKERYDYVLTLRRDLDDALFARLCGGQETLGFYARRTRPFLSGWVRFDSERHTMENHLRLMALLGCGPDAPQPSVRCTSGDSARVDALLGDGAREPGLIGLAPFGSTEAKTWEPGRAAALIDALAHKLDAPIALLGAPADRRGADAVLQRTASHVMDLVGRTGLPELCDVLRRCRLLVCVDSGPMHLAAALGVPTVALFGEEDPTLWGPYGPTPHRIVRAGGGRGRASLRAMSVEQALGAVDELLAATAVGSVQRTQPVEVRA